jgi:hypothetical protein
MKESKHMKVNYDFLEPGENVIMEGPANKQQFLGINKGGKLILTDKRLVFIAHALNVGKQFEEIPFSEIAVSGDTLNLFVPTPNMVKIVTRNGKTHQFVVSGKQKAEWKQKITDTVKESKTSERNHHY